MADDEAYMAEALEWALRYAERGFHVFPCHSVNADGSCTCGDAQCVDIGKHPRTTNGFKNASKDKAKIKKWFGAKAKLSNVAIRTGKVSGISVIDIDMGPGKMGAQTWGELCREHGEPPTLRAVTGSGGMHVFFQYNSAMKTSANTLGKHVDCRNDNGYVVAAPSKHRSGGLYAWDNWGSVCAALPAHLSRKKEGRGRPRKDDLVRGRYTIEQVRLMLEHVPADDRDLWRYVGIILGREFKRADEAWTVYVEWAAKWGGTKGRGHDAAMYTCFHEKSQESAENELSMGTIVKAAIDNGWVPSCIQEMNKSYAVVWLGGDCVILREHIAPDTGVLDVSFCSKGALKLFHAADPKVEKVNRVEYWLRHPDHRTYDGLVFQPGLTPSDPKFYNLWQGFAVEPKEGDCSLYLTHLKENICSGDDELYRYLLTWMANVVQSPGTRPGVAIVLRGKQGTGKGVFAKGFGRLFAPHFAHITNSHQLVGRFNALLKKAVLVFADEAFWAGDKQAEGTLNALVTEETHNIEPKGIDPFSVKNFMHLIIASNHEWVIPAASEARRWLVLDVSERYMQNHDYFKAIDTQMKNGGAAALLYELLHYDGSGEKLWTVPKTAALCDQQAHSMTPIEKFWFNCLKTGSHIGDRRDWDHGIYATDRGWQRTIRAAALYDAYLARSQEAGVKRRAMEMEMADALKKMVPKATHGRMTIEGDQVRGWTFPPLKECRTAFDEYMRWTYSWPKDDLDDPPNEVVSPECGTERDEGRPSTT